MKPPTLDLTFPHTWQAEILPARPLILPSRHYTYPREAEEIERGALELLVSPRAQTPHPETIRAPTHPAPHADLVTNANPAVPAPAAPFLATCAVGFLDPIAPTGLWSTPNPDALCAVSGGYAYLIDSSAPERFTMLSYRPVLQIVPVLSAGLLLFVGNRSILAWDQNGQRWESGHLSDEGISIVAIEQHLLNGRGWHMMTDTESPFTLDLQSGRTAAAPRT